MEELKRAVVQLQAMEVSMMQTLGKLEGMDKYLAATLSKFMIISTFLIGIMTVHLTMFGIWSFYVSTQNADIRSTIIDNRNLSEERDLKVQASINKVENDQKALIESSAENNYNNHSHNDESEALSQKMLSEIKSLVQFNQKLLKQRK